MSRYTVLIADDVPSVRDLLTTVIGSEDDMEIVAVASDGAEAVRLAREHQPEVVLLDIAMPRLDGLEAAQQIRDVVGEARILILSGFSADRMWPSAQYCGADGYLEKGCSPDDIVERIRELMGATV